ncbi:hypothetical protein A2239_01335 [Candidatus Uhrbacteria bacterium RIFOXYA2_FULL_40_9]|nr:MAG: hypothetical protein A2239_01335 [Candidatus Uhrbacteria bacterium RIFOXYA2_FULL_40_9]HCB56199.1 hypothetical protein [Candidatus Uhrbacteria bacterium]
MESIEPKIELWKEPEIYTLSLRRHSKYDTDIKSPRRGSLTPEGIQMAKDAAEEWKKNLPEGTDISIFESPSYLPAGERIDPETGETHMLAPRRATITASIYEKSLFGDLAPAKTDEESGMKQSVRRQKEPLIGDLMEHAKDGSKIPAFFKARGKAYGDDLPRFWHDFVTGNLPEEVEKTLKVAGGTCAKEQAQNMLTFILKTNQQPRSEKKQAGIALSHGEPQESLLHQMDKFLEETKGMNPGLYQGMIAHNKGMDLHMKPDGMMTIIKEGHPPVEIDALAFDQWLKQQ